jgi:hypothetical protein
VLGQENWSSNQINHGLGANARDARSLFIGWGNPAGFDHVSARGASADGDGNVWVADTFNSRVLRFPPGASVADLVLGQANFTARASACSFASNPTNGPLNRLCTPVLARINPDTGELYVVDEFPGGFPARLLVFAPPFSNGMAAARQLVPRQRLAGDYAGGYRFTHGTGLAFNPFKSDERVEPGGSTNRYRDGVLWLQANDARTLLLDATGEILLAVGAPDVTSRGGDYADFGACGQDPLAPYNLLWPGGGLGFDSANNIYLADETTHRVARFRQSESDWRPHPKHCRAGEFPSGPCRRARVPRATHRAGSSALHGVDELPWSDQRDAGASFHRTAQRVHRDQPQCAAGPGDARHRSRQPAMDGERTFQIVALPTAAAGGRATVAATHPSFLGGRPQHASQLQRQPAGRLRSSLTQLVGL